MRRPYPLLKRAADALVAAGLLLLCSPLLLLLALLVCLDSPGPVLFRQQRIGRGGHPFAILKFRSMVADAAQRGGYQTAKGDPRITRVGRWLRRSSLDELPQLINVLRGDMSLVGPRPDVPAQQSLYAPRDWQLRCSVRPGITGLAQATLRSTATASQRLELDLRYVRQQSLTLDLQVLVQTAGQVMWDGGF
jgi:lipopolysaccharide/colanic/teichoic acid biosynthesis glycosyltransferase